MRVVDASQSLREESTPPSGSSQPADSNLPADFNVLKPVSRPQNDPSPK